MTRRVRAKTVSLLLLVALITGLASQAVIGAAVIQADNVRYVSPSGSDANDGSADRPLKTIQKALDISEPGGVIQLAPGRYAQDFATVRGGVTISGPEDAIVVGAGGSRIAQVKHDDVRLTGFTIDGRHSSIDSASSYRDKLIYAMSTTARDGVDRIRIDNMTLTNGGGECVRLRYFVTAAVVEDNTISNCGVHDFRFNGGSKNGEAIYIGTAPEQRGANGAPTADPDVSRDNVVRNNTVDSQGDECVDVKEDSTANLVEGNSCTGQKDPDSASTAGAAATPSEATRSSATSEPASVSAVTPRPTASTTRWSTTSSGTTNAAASRSCATPRTPSAGTTSLSRISPS